MTFRSYDYTDFTSPDTWIECDFNYRKDTTRSERTADWIETFATASFLITLNTVVFQNEKDAVIFTLGYKE